MKMIITLVFSSNDNFWFSFFLFAAADAVDDSHTIDIINTIKGYSVNQTENKMFKKNDEKIFVPWKIGLKFKMPFVCVLDIVQLL